MGYSVLSLNIRSVLGTSNIRTAASDSVKSGEYFPEEPQC